MTLTRPYLTPEQLSEISIANLTSDEVRTAIDKYISQAHHIEEVEKAALVLQRAGIPVNAESLERLRKPRK